jgi:hypothetical protein
MTRRDLAHAAITLVATFTLGIAAHGTAPTAEAEGCLGATYQQAVGHAGGAIVGVISKIGKNESDVSFASEVTIERVVGTKSGTLWRGTAYPGYCWCCGDDPPQVGARVVVLLDVTVPTAQPPGDRFYTIGVTVTPAQVARLAADLPDTATIAEGTTIAAPASFVPPILLGVFLGVAALLVRHPMRRASRARSATRRTLPSEVL